jgi:hypothetical protein
LLDARFDACLCLHRDTAPASFSRRIRRRAALKIVQFAKQGQAQS